MESEFEMELSIDELYSFSKLNKYLQEAEYVISSPLPNIIYSKRDMKFKLQILFGSIIDTEVIYKVQSTYSLFSILWEHPIQGSLPVWPCCINEVELLAGPGKAPETPGVRLIGSHKKSQVSGKGGGFPFEGPEKPNTWVSWTCCKAHSWLLKRWHCWCRR